MLRIVIALHACAPSLALVSGLRSITGLGLSEIRARLQGGATLFDRELFLNDHDDVASMLRELLRMADLRASEIEEVSIREVGFESSAHDADDRLSAEVLQNVLNRHAETLRRFER